jgi:hypothetical protein
VSIFLPQQEARQQLTAGGCILFDLAGRGAPRSFVVDDSILSSSLNPSQSRLVVFSPLIPPSVLVPPSTALSPPSLDLKCIDLEVDLYSEVEPTPLLCCPAVNDKEYSGQGHSDWIFYLVKQFRHVVVLSCDGFEEQLSALFAAIIASNAKQGVGSSPKAGKRGTRELNGCSALLIMKRIVTALHVAGKR